MSAAGVRVMAAAAGVVSGGVAMAAAHLAAGVIRPDASPVLAVGGSLVDATPRQVKDFAIRTFGSSDKPVLLAGIGIVLALFAAAIGLLARRRLDRGIVAVIFLGAIGALAVLSRPSPSVVDLIPTALGTVAGCYTLRYLIDLLPTPASSPSPATSSPAAPSAATSSPATSSPAAGAATSASRKTISPASATSAAGSPGAVDVAGARVPASAAAESVAPDSVAGRGGESRAVARSEAWVAPDESAAPSGGQSASGDPSILSDGPVPGGRAAAGAGGVVDGADRRRFLVGAAWLAGAAALAGLGGKWLAGLRFSAKGSRDAVTLPSAVSPAVGAAGADPGAGGVAYITRNSDFYRVDTALIVPQVAAETWSLRVHGKVRNEFSISYAELTRMPMIERVITLACVSNDVGGEYVGTARWLGVPVRTVLARAGIDPNADQLVCRSKDGMTIGAPTSIVLDGRDSLFAVGMNGEPLPLEHGFPVRMVVPGLYGYCSACKWIVDVEASRFGDYDAYWVREGWARVAEIRTESRIDTPRDGGTVSAGRVAVAGVAWAQHRGISAVEVSVDGGAWAPARLASEPTKDAWRLWTYAWDARPGKHTIAVRATDGTGAVQTEARAEPYPSGATGYHSILVDVR